MIIQAVTQVCQRHPDKVAIIQGQAQITYRELLARITAAADHLQSMGLQQGEAVALHLPNGIDFAISCLSVMACNAIAVPVNTRFQSDEVKYFLESSAARFTIHHAKFREMLSAMELPGLQLIAIDEWDYQGRSPSNDPAAAPEFDGSALYMYSSGSTGKPKRVTRTQLNLLEEFKSLESTIALTADDRILCTVPMYHAHGFNNCLFAALLGGGTLIVAENDFNPRDTMKLIQNHAVSIYPAVPFMLKMIGDGFYSVKPELPSLRLVFSAGAPLPLEVAAKFNDLFGVFPVQLYGSTETGAAAINYQGDAGSAESVGKPLHGVQIEVLSEEGEVLPDGEMGEIAISSPAMTRQYDDLPETTAECFRDGRFFPGDLGYRDESGRVFIKGRKKLLINVAGNKVDPLDVEALIATHPKVREVVVLGVPDANYGEMVKAVVVAESEFPADEIIALCSERLAWYKVPKKIEFRSEIPRSPLGKILRKYLQDEQG
jgi:long-chain acyl-CoA synthetase